MSACSCWPCSRSWTQLIATSSSIIKKWSSMSSWKSLGSDLWSSPDRPRLKLKRHTGGKIPRLLRIHRPIPDVVFLIGDIIHVEGHPYLTCIIKQTSIQQHIAGQIESTRGAVVDDTVFTCIVTTGG